MTSLSFFVGLLFLVTATQPAIPAFAVESGTSPAPKHRGPPPQTEAEAEAASPKLPPAEPCDCNATQETMVPRIEKDPALQKHGLVWLVWCEPSVYNRCTPTAPQQAFPVIPPQTEEQFAAETAAAEKTKSLKGPGPIGKVFKASAISQGVNGLWIRMKALENGSDAEVRQQSNSP